MFKSSKIFFILKLELSLLFKIELDQEELENCGYFQVEEMGGWEIGMGESY